MISKIHRANIYLLSFVIFMIATPVQAESLKGAEKALVFFEDISDKWEEILMPLARRQAERDLRRLSNSLDDLALDKQELTESILAAYPHLNQANANKINESIQAFKNTVRRLRRNLSKFTSNLPNQYQQEGKNVSQKLFTGLSSKWQTLDEIGRWITESDTFSAEKIKTESSSLVDKVQKMKEIIDTLRIKISIEAPISRGRPT